MYRKGMYAIQYLQQRLEAVVVVSETTFDPGERCQPVVQVSLSAREAAIGPTGDAWQDDGE